MPKYKPVFKKEDYCSDNGFSTLILENIFLNLIFIIYKFINIYKK